jgi:Holliday junction DNA helicase RuvA
MIDYISGKLESKSSQEIVIEAGGIGYKISIAASAFSKFPNDGNQIKIYIVEAVAGMYGGVINLYGFLTKEERDMFLLIKDEVPKTGAKKALEYLDKVSKSFSDFRSAVLKKDSVMLSNVFGFTKKTSDKLIAALKDKISNIDVSSDGNSSLNKGTSNTIITDAIMALISLGIKEIQARDVIDRAFEEDKNISLENLIKKALKYTGASK